MSSRRDYDSWWDWAYADSHYSNRYLDEMQWFARFTLNLIQRFDLTRYSAENESIFSEDYLQAKQPVLGINAKIIEQFDSDPENSEEHVFELKFAYLLYSQSVVKEGRRTEPFWMPIYTAQICKLLRFNPRIRDFVGFKTLKDDGEVDWEDDFYNIAKYSRKLLADLSSGTKIELEYDVSESILIKSISEYYQLNHREGIKAFVDRVFTPLRKYDPGASFRREDGIYSRFSTAKNLHPSYTLVLCCSIIDSIFESTIQEDLMRDVSKRGLIEHLLAIGTEIIKEGLHKKEHPYIAGHHHVPGEETFRLLELTFRKQGMLASLFNSKFRTFQEAYYECSNLSQMDNFFSNEFDNLFLCSTFVKTNLLTHTGRTELLEIYVNQYGEYSAVSSGDYLFPWSNLSKPYPSSLQASGYDLKDYLSREIRQIKSTGKGVVKRYGVNYSEQKNMHHGIYRQIDIPTQLPKKGRGRKIEILFPHQNKSLENIEKEVNYIPSSFEKCLDNLEKIDSILTTPYIIVVSIDHIFQFSRCLISMGGMKNIDSSALADIQIQTERVQDILFRFGCLNLHDAFAHLAEQLLCLRDSGKVDGNDQSRLDIIEFQSCIKSMYFGLEDQIIFDDIFELLRKSKGIVTSNPA